MRGSLLSPSLALLPLSLSKPATRLGVWVSRGVLSSAGRLPGATLAPLTLTVAGKAGAATPLLPRMRPPTVNSWMRCTTVPICASLPSPNTPLTGSRLTYRLLSIKSPLMRTRASVPGWKWSALAPLPPLLPRAASSPRSAPTSRCSPRAEPPICSSCRPPTARSPEASALVTSCANVALMFMRQADAVLPALMLLARPWMLQSPPLMAPPTATLPSV